MEPNCDNKLGWGRGELGGRGRKSAPDPDKLTRALNVLAMSIESNPDLSKTKEMSGVVLSRVYPQEISSTDNFSVIG